MKLNKSNTDIEKAEASFNKQTNKPLRINFGATIKEKNKIKVIASSQNKTMKDLIKDYSYKILENPNHLFKIPPKIAETSFAIDQDFYEEVNQFVFKHKDSIEKNQGIKLMTAQIFLYTLIKLIPNIPKKDYKFDKFKSYMFIADLEDKKKLEEIADSRKIKTRDLINEYGYKILKNPNYRFEIPNTKDTLNFKISQDFIKDLKDYIEKNKDNIRKEQGFKITHKIFLYNIINLIIKSNK